MILWAPVWGPKTTAKTGLATEGLPSSRACADIHACRAWRTIARGAAKSWKPSGMQNLSCTRGDNRNLHYFLPGGKNFADKTTPVSGSVFGPQTGAKSSGHKQIKLRLNEWTPFWGPFWTPKRGSFCRQNCGHRAKKSTSFDCFFMYATEVSHTAGFPGLCSAASTCSPTPCEHLCPTHVLELGRPSVATPVLLVFLDPKMKVTNSPENAI